jgi:hypothetical protein
MTPEVVTKTVLNKIILNVWIENGPILKYGPVIELAFRSNSYVEHKIFILVRRTRKIVFFNPYCVWHSNPFCVVENKQLAYVLLKF